MPPVKRVRRDDAARRERRIVANACEKSCAACRKSGAAFLDGGPISLHTHTLAIGTSLAVVGSTPRERVEEIGQPALGSIPKT